MVVPPGAAPRAALFGLADVDGTQDEQNGNEDKQQKQWNRQVPHLHQFAEEAADGIVCLIRDVLRNGTLDGSQRDQIARGDGVSVVDRRYRADDLAGIQRRLQLTVREILDLRFDLGKLAVVGQQNADIVLGADDHVAAPLGVENVRHTDHGRV